MADIFADEDVPYRLQDCLRLLGHNVATVRQFCEDKRGDAWPDEEVLRFACQHRWIVLTFNVSDFQRLAARNPDHFGIVLGDPEADKKVQARRINRLLRSADNVRGLVIDSRLSSKPKPRKRRRRRK
ncbi:MAG TPA: DUF5615 family PIN-like protein [Pirellulaceae bacterium]|jgi:predicted nuclease of predicted toxin-antitoxin system